MRRILFLWCLLMAAVSLQAQKLTVEKMEADPMDLSASTQLRNDRNGNPCGLVKVQLAAVGAQFEGNVIGDVAYKTGEYWVYMNDGAYLLRIKHPNFLPLDLNFRDYGIRKVEGKCVYVLTLLMPQTGVVVKKQKLIVNYSPSDAIVIIDSKSYWGNGRLELDLEVGSHDYQIVAKGYEIAEGSIKLNENAPRTITENLVATKLEQQQSQVVVQQPVQQQTIQQPVDEFSGKTAQQMADIAEDYFYGRNGRTKDYALAVKWARKAADLGNSQGQFRLGVCYDNGRGVPQDYAEAVKWLRKAAEQGHAKAQSDLGFFYESGRGVTQDYAEALKWYRKAVKQGDADAQFSLGFCYNYGHGVTQDYAEAVKWYRKSAEQGYVMAQYYLGYCYEKGHGVTQDYTEAVMWYRKSAEQGYALAQYRLGICSYYGYGVTQDYAEAVKWWSKSAEQGRASAQCVLGGCYYHGKGVIKDIEKARELWRKAAAQGDQEAKDYLKKYFNE